MVSLLHRGLQFCGTIVLWTQQAARSGSARMTCVKDSCPSPAPQRSSEVSVNLFGRVEGNLGITSPRIMDWILLGELFQRKHGNVSDFQFRKFPPLSPVSLAGDDTSALLVKQNPVTSCWEEGM